MSSRAAAFSDRLREASIVLALSALATSADAAGPLDARPPEAWRPVVERIHVAARPSPDTPEPDLQDLAAAQRQVADATAFLVSREIARLLAAELKLAPEASSADAVEALGMMIARETRVGSGLGEEDPAGLALIGAAALREPGWREETRVPAARCLAATAWPESGTAEAAAREGTATAACRRALSDAERRFAAVAAARVPAAGRSRPAVVVVAEPAEGDAGLWLSQLGTDYRLETIARWIEDEIALPRPVTILARACGAPGVRSEPATATVTVCAETARDLMPFALAARFKR